MTEYTAQQVQQAFKDNEDKILDAVVNHLAPQSSHSVQNDLRTVISGCIDKAVNEAPTIAAELNAEMQDSGAMEANSGQPVMADGGMGLPDMTSIILDLLKGGFEQVAREIGVVETQIAIAVCIALAIGLLAGYSYAQYEQEAAAEGIQRGAVDEVEDRIQ